MKTLTRAEDIAQAVPSVHRGFYALPTRAATASSASQTPALSNTSGFSILPVLPALQALLPDGGLRAGASHAVVGSLSLLITLLAASSMAGSWCGVIGVPEFGIEAAERCGVDLSRTALVPEPGQSWLTVTATLVDAIHLVAVRLPPAASITAATVSRLGARLRMRNTALIVLESATSRAARWPGVHTRLSVTASRWGGLGVGYGYLHERVVTVHAEPRSGRTIERDLLIADSDISDVTATIPASHGVTPSRLRALAS